VLDAALDLLAEQGYAGASLRKLAARVGMSQPSLYHYFRTKEELVEQVLATYAGDMFGLDPAALPRRLEDVPRWIVQTVYEIYARPSHAKFVRVAFSVSRVNPRFGALLRTIFVDQADVGMRLVMQRFVAAGEIAADEAADFCRVIINAIGLRFMEEKVLFEERELGDSFHRFAELVVHVGETWIRAQRRP
jgi:AcrR family transcriptional regulator